MMLSSVGDAKLGPPSLVVIAFDGFFHSLRSAFQGVES